MTSIREPTTGNQTGKSRLQIWNLSSQNEAVSENNPMLPLQVRKFTDQVYAKILKQVGTQNYQASTAGQMDQCIQSCAALLKRHNLGKILVPVLGTEDDSSTKNDRTAKIACLMLLNACLMQARLEKHMLDLKTLDRIRVSRNIATGLVSAWKTILKQDFRPVYVLPLDILKVLDSSAQEPETRKDLHKALKRLIICAQENADNFAKLGFDHAGPLYHKLLPGAESDGAFYTNNVSAVLLAGLALDKNFCNWKDRKAISRLKIIDPAMGTGTLLMAGRETDQEEPCRGHERPLSGAECQTAPVLGRKCDLRFGHQSARSPDGSPESDAGCSDCGLPEDEPVHDAAWAPAGWNHESGLSGTSR